ncbi:MAG TPA: pitrilysin family protein, partial [Candidatus Limnocylindrales bacterium]|nr:pitrilysin family protein [Candidatus Limnocylindrales bacterium]
RLNDILQARADPRRRVEEALIETIYSPASPYHRPAGGVRETVERLDADVLRHAYGAAAHPVGSALIVAGELGGVDVPALAERLFGSWPGGAGPGDRSIPAEPASRSRRVRVMHRPGSVQTEIRLGHVGRRRRIPDFHALAVTGAILGGLFNSRLNRRLREEKGYTYGASASFDLRRSAGPFAARAAVQTAVTVPAIIDAIAELVAIREAPVRADELTAARDFLIGVFPLRFETPGPIVAALSNLVINGLPDDELARYRERIEAVTAEDVLEVAQANVRPDELQVVLVGDADAFATDLAAASIGDVTVDRDEPAAAHAETD